MIDQLFNLIKNQMQENSSEFKEVPNEINDNVYNEAHDVIVNGIQNMDQNSIMALMNDAQADNLGAESPQVNQLAQQFSGNISEKLGINSNLAKTIAIAVIPIILKKLFSGSKPSTDSTSGFSFDGILGSILGGGNTQSQSKDGGVLGQLSNIGASLGLDKDGDGDVDLNDIAGMFKK